MLPIIYSGRQHRIRWPYPIGLPPHHLLVPPGTNIKTKCLISIVNYYVLYIFCLIWIIKRARWRLYCSEVGDGLFQYVRIPELYFFSSDLGIAHLYRFKIIETKLRRSCWNNTNKPSHYYQGHICLFIEYCFEEKRVVSIPPTDVITLERAEEEGSRLLYIKRSSLHLWKQFSYIVSSSIAPLCRERRALLPHLLIHTQEEEYYYDDDAHRMVNRNNSHRDGRDFHGRLRRRSRRPGLQVFISPDIFWWCHLKYMSICTGDSFSHLLAEVQP